MNFKMAKINWALAIELVSGGMDPFTFSFSQCALITQMVPVFISQPGSPSRSSGCRGEDGQT